MTFNFLNKNKCETYQKRVGVDQNSKVKSTINYTHFITTDR